RAPCAVAQLRRNHERALTALFHGRNTLVPSLDDAALPEGKRERATAVDGAVELRALGVVHPEPAGVVHHARLALRRHRPRAGAGVLVLQPARSRRHRHGRQHTEGDPSWTEESETVFTASACRDREGTI